MRFVLRLLTGLAVLLFHHHVGAQQVQLHASTIVPGDLAVLTVIYRNQRPSMFKLDTSPLEQDFDVIDVKSKISMDRQGGTFANRMIWRVMLAPKRSGLLRIPPLTIREAVTPELQLTVLPENPWLVSGEDIRLELSANKQ